MMQMMKPADSYRSILLALIVAAITAATGCSGAKRTAAGATATPESNAAAEALLARLRQSYTAIPDLSVNGTLKISGTTIWFDAIVRAHDSMKVNLIGPFGVPLGALSATQEEFLFLNAQEGEALEGRPDRETFSKLMMIQLDYSEMVAMLRGELPRFPDPGTYTAVLDDNEIHYEARSAGTLERFTIDADDVTLLTYSRSAIAGSTTSEELAITYRDYTLSSGGRSFPRRGLVDIGGGQQRLTITIDRVRDRIDADRSCRLDLPPGIERRRL